MIELPEPDAYQGRRYSTDSEDPGWGTWITLSVDEVEHWENLIAAGYKREVRELIATDQLRTYGDQRAAEAREQMREELLPLLKRMANNYGWVEHTPEYPNDDGWRSVGHDGLMMIRKLEKMK